MNQFNYAGIANPFICPMQQAQNTMDLSSGLYVLDFKRGDVTGDGMPDNVYLIGTREPSSGLFTRDITLIIQNGATGLITQVSLTENAGYNARIFLGDFTKDNVADIKVTIDSGGSGGFIYSYIYTLRNNMAVLIFDQDQFNEEYQYDVEYRNNYKVDVIRRATGEVFTIDISERDPSYLSEIYNPDGTLKQPVSGFVNPLGGLWPLATDEKTTNFDLLATQRIAGLYNADLLGYIETFLSWNGTRFAPVRIQVAVLGNEPGENTEE